MDKVPQCQAKNGNLNSRGCAVKTRLFCGQQQEVLESTKAGVSEALPGGDSALCARRQMDGLELPALNDLSGAHRKLLSLEGIKVKQRA